MNKKYYDGFIVHDILDKHLDAKKMMEVLKAFAEVKGVDAVEVVRCKECKHYEPTGTGYMWGTCGENIHDVDERDWCCWAERKEE